MNLHLDGILGFSGVKHKYVCKETGLFVMCITTGNIWCRNEMLKEF
jgi:hypothetical protein